MIPELISFIANRIWRHCQSSARGRCTHFIMTDSKRATMTSWYRFIVTFYLGCMVSEITRFYCQPNMTSPWFHRQWALHAIFYDGFCKSDHDFLIVIFLIVIHSNFLSAIGGIRDNEVLLSTGYELIISRSSGCAARTFSWWILKERRWLPDSVPY